MLIENLLCLCQFSPLFEIIEFFDKDVDPFNEEIGTFPDGPPLTVSLSSDQVSTNLLNLSCENVVAEDNSVKFLDAFANVFKSL